RPDPDHRLADHQPGRVQRAARGGQERNAADGRPQQVIRPHRGAQGTALAGTPSSPADSLWGVAIPAGRYALGPDDGTLSVRTQRTGAAAMAGHNLLFHVTSWEAVLVVGDDPANAVIEISADGGSLRVQEGQRRRPGAERCAED